MLAVTPSALEDEPAYMLDMLLAIDGAINKGQDNAQRKASK